MFNVLSFLGGYYRYGSDGNGTAKKMIPRFLTSVLYTSLNNTGSTSASWYQVRFLCIVNRFKSGTSASKPNFWSSMWGSRKIINNLSCISYIAILFSIHPVHPSTVLEVISPSCPAILSHLWAFLYVNVCQLTSDKLVTHKTHNYPLVHVYITMENHNF